MGHVVDLLSGSVQNPSWLGLVLYFLQGISVGPFVEETGLKKNVGRRAKRGLSQVKVTPEQNCMGFDVQNPCNQSHSKSKESIPAE